MNTSKLIVFSCLLLGAFTAAQEDCESGLPIQNVRKSAKFLNRFGYLTIDPSELSDDELECAIAEGMGRMQEFHGLPKTRKLNTRTLQKMEEPRCGHPDIESEEVEVSRKKRYALSNSRWEDGTVLHTVYINYTSDMNTDMQESVMEMAIDKWNNVANTPLTFHDRHENFATSDAKVKIYHSEYYADGSVFDTDILAYASLPRGGKVYFNDRQTWDPMYLPGKWSDKSYLHVALHELGHILGIQHSDNDDAVMWPYYSKNRVDLHQDDKNAAIELFGCC